ncbi:MAG: flotillin domain-containing protein [Gaiellaceae bacterium]
MRSIVGALTVEEIIRERSRLAEETRKSSAHEMERLGLVIDSLQIQEIDDPTNYILNLAERTGMAEARAIEAKGMAEAATVKAKLTAEAEGIEARARALEKNQQAVIQQALVEQLPETVRAAAEAYRGIDHLVVMNGAEGMNDITGQVLGAGLATLPLLQDLLNGRNGGAREREEERPASS